jgi:TonB family protein
METTIQQNKREQENKRRGRLITTIVHILLIILAFLPLLTFPDPPPGQEGILVSFGQPDAGRNSEEAGGDVQEQEIQEAIAEAQEEEKRIEEERVEAAAEAEAEAEPEPEIEPAPEDPVPERDIVEDVNSEEIKLRNEEEARKRQEAEDKARQEREAQERADEEARKKAEAEAEAARQAAEEEARKRAEAEKLKNEIGGLFGDGDGEGEGDGGKPGNQGDPNGGDSDILEGITTGTGRVGGGLGSRGGSGPRITDNSQETGRVVIKVCVGSNGRVVSAEFTQSGSTTASNTLIRLAKANAQKWTFKPGEVDKQCGTITYDFKVK